MFHHRIIVTLISAFSYGVQWIDAMYPDLSCQCGFVSYDAPYYSKNINRTGSLAQFNDDCEAEISDCDFKQCVLFSMNILVKPDAGESENQTETDSNNVILASEVTVSGFIQQLFSSKNRLKNYLSTAVVTNGIMELKAKVPKTDDCTDDQWNDFFKELDHVWHCGEYKVFG